MQTRSNDANSDTFDLLVEQFKNVRITTRQLAQFMGIDFRSLQNGLGAGRYIIPTYKEGKHRYVDLRDLASYLDAKRRSAA